MFMSQFSYEIVYKKGRLHTNTDGLSRMTYEPVEAPTPTVTGNLTDDNFVIAMELKMSECDFNSWMIQLANESREDYRLGMKLQNYTMAIEIAFTHSKVSYIHKIVICQIVCDSWSWGYNRLVYHPG